MLSRNSLSIHKVSSNVKESMGFYRFIHNEKVTESSILSQLLSIQKKPSITEELLVISDTCQINMHHLKGSIKEGKGIGYLNDDRTLGYYFHGSIVLNKAHQVCGISDSLMYSRAKAEKKLSKTHHRDSLPMEEKESYRWYLGVKHSTKYLGNPKRLTFIQDREGDIYEVMDKLEKQGSNFIIRCQHNRSVKTIGGQEPIRLRTFLKRLPVAGKYKILAPIDERGNKTREAELSIRFSKIYIQAPRHQRYKTNFAAELPCNVVEVLEDNPPAGYKAVHWILFTNKEVKTKEDALGNIRNYCGRWNIEDVFRGMKNKGLRVDSAELKSGNALRKIAIMGFEISTVALKLRQARDGVNAPPIEEVFDEQQQQCLEELCPNLEGNTEKLSNPHDRNSLAWAAWIIARLGGWKGYKSQRPPGIITMENGLRRFMDLFLGWSIRIP